MPKTRRGLAKGKGKGYKNVIGKDPAVHSQSAKGIKQPQELKNVKDYSEELKQILKSELPKEVYAESEIQKDKKIVKLSIADHELHPRTLNKILSAGYKLTDRSISGGIVKEHNYIFISK